MSPHIFFYFLNDKLTFIYYRLGHSESFSLINFFFSLGPTEEN